MKAGRMLVTGAGGMVGSYVPEVFQDWDLTLTDLLPGCLSLDVRDREGVWARVRETRPDWVLHLAAATDVDRCEQEPDWAFSVNAQGTLHLVEACREIGAGLVYVSTAAVFSGTKAEPYVESDKPDPANLYGRSKLAGERHVAESLRRYHIVRSSWMIGGGEKDKKFVGVMTRLMLDGKSPLRVVDDKRGSPTYAKDLLKGIRELIRAGHYGVTHMANGGCCSRYEIALVLRGLLQRDTVEITPVPSSAFPLPAPRPDMEALRNLRLEKLGLHLMRPWQEALRDYLASEMVRLPSP